MVIGRPLPPLGRAHGLPATLAITVAAKMRWQVREVLRSWSSSAHVERTEDRRKFLWTPPARSGVGESGIAALPHEFCRSGLRDDGPASVRVSSGPRQNIVTPHGGSRFKNLACRTTHRTGPRSWVGRSSTVISVRPIGRMKMTESPLQTNKVWAVMLYSNSGDVIGGVRTALTCSGLANKPWPKPSLGSLTTPSLGSVSMMTSTPPNYRITLPTSVVGCYRRDGTRRFSGSRPYGHQAALVLCEMPSGNW